MMVGNIASFETMGLVDGPGVRFVVFMQGCPLRCAYCHNPEMWNEKESKIRLTPEELFEKVKRYKPYFGSEGGVTVSGGEPLMQADFVTEFFKICRQNQIHTCLDTSGYGENFEELLKFCDLVILDVKELDHKKYKDLTGKSDEKFFQFLNACQAMEIPLWIRQVIVPKFNDTLENVLRLKDFVDGLKNVERVELLPYHDMAKKKYEELGLKFRLSDTMPMDKEKCKKLEKILRKNS